LANNAVPAPAAPVPAARPTTQEKNAERPVETKTRTPVPIKREAELSASKSSKRRSSISSTSSVSVVPPVETPSHRKESKRKRKNEVEESIETQTGKAQKKKSRRKIDVEVKEEDEAGPLAPVVPTPTHIPSVDVKSCLSPYDPRNASPAPPPMMRSQQQTQPGTSIVYFSYFEEPPAHQLEHEDRDHNHFLSEAKALKHAADKQVIFHHFLDFPHFPLVICSYRRFLLSFDSKRTGPSKQYNI
jgi:hypothetical protein